MPKEEEIKQTKGKVTNPTGKGGFRDNPANRNKAGQRNGAAVAFSTELRRIMVEVGEEKVDATIEGKKRIITRVEGAVRGLYNRAAKGDVSAFGMISEKVEGKVAQEVANHLFVHETAVSDMSDEDLAVIASKGLFPAKPKINDED